MFQYPPAHHSPGLVQQPVPAAVPAVPKIVVALVVLAEAMVHVVLEPLLGLMVAPRAVVHQASLLNDVTSMVVRLVVVRVQLVVLAVGPQVVVPQAVAPKIVVSLVVLVAATLLVVVPLVGMALVPQVARK